MVYAMDLNNSVIKRLWCIHNLRNVKIQMRKALPKLIRALLLTCFSQEKNRNLFASVSGVLHRNINNYMY